MYPYHVEIEPDSDQSRGSSNATSHSSSGSQPPVPGFRTEHVQQNKSVPIAGTSSSSSGVASSQDSGQSGAGGKGTKGHSSGDPEIGQILNQRIANVLQGVGKCPQQRARATRGEGDSGREKRDLALNEAERQHLQAVLSEAGLWSQGSSAHLRGKCKPCHYVRSRAGCDSGEACEYCHFPHTGKSRRQLGMSARLHCKAFADALSAAYDADPALLARALRACATCSAYLSTLLERQPGSELPEDGAASSGAAPLGQRGESSASAAAGEPAMPRKNIVSV